MTITPRTITLDHSEIVKALVQFVTQRESDVPENAVCTATMHRITLTTDDFLIQLYESSCNPTPQYCAEVSIETVGEPITPPCWESGHYWTSLNVHENGYQIECPCGWTSGVSLFLERIGQEFDQHMREEGVTK